jgi:fructokinase
VAVSSREQGPSPVIVVAGEALVDLLAGQDGRITPVTGGGPYNAARAVGRLGVRCAWLGSLSSDRFGQVLEAALAADGVSLALAQRTDLPTTLALAELDAKGVATFRFYADGTSATALGLGPLAAGLPPGTRALYAGSLGFVLEPMASTLEALVTALPDDVLLMVDPNCRPSITRDPDAYRARLARVLVRADVLRASADDLAFLVPGADLEGALHRLADSGPGVVVCTDGASPVTILAGGERHRLAVIDSPVVDTVGAGDTFGGALLDCLVHDGRTRADVADPSAVRRAAGFAVRAGAWVIGRQGADPPRLADLGGWPES